MRKEDVSQAYYGCHTDITIPYEELGAIPAVLHRMTASHGTDHPRRPICSARNRRAE